MSFAASQRAYGDWPTPEQPRIIVRRHRSDTPPQVVACSHSDFQRHQKSSNRAGDMMPTAIRPARTGGRVLSAQADYGCTLFPTAPTRAGWPETGDTNARSSRLQSGVRHARKRPYCGTPDTKLQTIVAERFVRRWTREHVTHTPPRPAFPSFLAQCYQRNVCRCSETAPVDEAGWS